MSKDKTTGYSRLVGCIYLFNLMVGTGVLTLPKAFQQAGLLLSGLILGVLCFLSYITSTFVIESMSIANGLNKLSILKNENQNRELTEKYESNDETNSKLGYDNCNFEIDILEHEKSDDPVPFDDVVIQESSSIPTEASHFEITDVFEMGQMAIIFFNRFGVALFYLSMCIYLYGDLAIYAAAIATTIRDIGCTYKLEEAGSNFTGKFGVLGDSDLCWAATNISRINAYRIFLAAFLSLSCPFVFFNLSKTKLIQFVTIALRWIAFGIMFSLMAIYLPRASQYGQIKIADFTKLPNLLGICIYSFMCHHSLPSLVTPINKKNNIYLLFFLNVTIILVFYLLLCFLSTFTFVDIQSLITLNFQPGGHFNQPSITNIAFFQYYLSLFPVFCITASFPIIGITLRNNLRNLITHVMETKHDNWFMGNMFYPLLAIVPPIIVVFSTNNITFLVGFTGSYAGTFVQYVIPTCLVMCARHQLQKFLKDLNEKTSKCIDGPDEMLQQIHQSPFKHKIWSITILIWSGISIIFVSLNHILAAK